MISGRTRVLAVLGRPVAHSLSPAMHNAAFRALGLDAVYVALDCAAESVAPLMTALAAAGGGGNVTVPHKGAAAAAAGLAGACNTFWGEAGQLRGANTDPDGILHALARLGCREGRWLVVGTGGSAHGVVEAAHRAGARLAVRSRSADRASALMDQAARAGVMLVGPAECDVIINTTPLGLAPNDPLPLSLADCPEARTVLDLVYARGGTPLVRAARTLGLAAEDGREVLLGQGAAAFGHWFPGVPAPVEVMRAAIRAGLE